MNSKMLRAGYRSAGLLLALYVGYQGMYFRCTRWCSPPPPKNTCIPVNECRSAGSATRRAAHAVPRMKSLMAVVFSAKRVIKRSNRMNRTIRIQSAALFKVQVQR